MLIRLHICNDKIPTRKSEIVDFFVKLKFDEKAFIAMSSRSMQLAMFLKLTQILQKHWKM